MSRAKSSTAILHWPLAKLTPYGRNPRKNDHAVKKMAAAIKEFGFKIPILARSSGEVVDGHLRLKAAQALSLKTVPVLLCDEWTPAKVKAFRLMVNKSSEWAEWDKQKLHAELVSFSVADLALIGFDAAELEELMPADLTQADGKLEDIPLPAPALTWVLLAIPTAQYGSIAERIATLASVPNVRCEISVTSRDD